MNIHIVELIQALVFGSETLHEITIREPRAKDFDGIDMTKLTHGDVVRKMLSRCSGVSDRALAEMDAIDFLKCMEVMFTFLENFRATTPTARESSPTSSTSSPPSLANSPPLTSTSGLDKQSEYEHIET